MAIIVRSIMISCKSLCVFFLREKIDTFVGSLLSMIASIMVTEVSRNEIKRVDREVKIYLNNVHIVQQQVNEEVYITPTNKIIGFAYSCSCLQ